MSERRKKRVLVLTSTFPRWEGDPTPMFVADLAQGMSDRFDMTVLAPASDGARDSDQVANMRVLRFRYGWPASTQKLADGAILPNVRRNRLLAAQAAPFVAAQLNAAWQLVRRERFDAIHAHWAIPQGIVASLIKSRTGIPVLTTTHGADVYGLRAQPFVSMKKWAMQRSNAITAVSTDLKREIVALGIDSTRVRVLPMGVDTHRFSPEHASPELRERWPGDAPLLLFVGRLAEKKGVRYAIEAMPLILRDQPQARLVIIGDGPERASLEALARNAGVANRVSFLGAIANADLPVYYASADLFVGPSIVGAGGDTEAFGVVFAESLSSGTPVITTDAGGITDVVRDGVTGTIVAQRDPGAIAAAVFQLAGDEATVRAQRGIHDMRSRFDHRSIHAAYGDLIDEITA